MELLFGYIKIVFSVEVSSSPCSLWIRNDKWHRWELYMKTAFQKLAHHLRREFLDSRESFAFAIIQLTLSNFPAYVGKYSFSVYSSLVFNPQIVLILY